MSTVEVSPDQWELLKKAGKDLQKSSELLSREQARYLVDMYYQIQDFRIQAAGQKRASSIDGEPHAVVGWVFDSMHIIEKNIQNALGRFARSYTVGQWLQSLTGIGPVISAGLLAHLDVRDRPTAGHFWSFAGLNPTAKWEKKQKRPWNAKLKVLLWKAGESFVKTQSLESDYYGKLFVARKAKEWQWNLEGLNAGAATAAIEARDYGKDTNARAWYSGQFTPEAAREWLDKEPRPMQPDEKNGDCGLPMLPPAHVHARARRWVEKLFLSHVHHVMYEDYYGTAPSQPYAFEQLKNEDHRHYLAPPNWPVSKAGKSLRELLG